MITGNENGIKAQKPVRMIYVRKNRIKLIIQPIQNHFSCTESFGGCRAEGSLSALNHPSLPPHAT
jgi:hypothetical protein